MARLFSVMQILTVTQSLYTKTFAPTKLVAIHNLINSPLCIFQIYPKTVSRFNSRNFLNSYFLRFIFPLSPISST